MKRGRVVCPRCKPHPGRSPFQHDHGFDVMPAGPAHLEREIAVVKQWARCSLCEGKKYLTRAQISAFNSGRRGNE